MSENIRPAAPPVGGAHRPQTPTEQPGDAQFRWPVVLVPAAGIALMMASELLHWTEALEALGTMWRPVVTITSIMVIAAAAGRLGVIDRIAAAFFPMARGSTMRLFAITFALSAITAAVLNNDSAILLLTPLVIVLVRRIYPDRPRMIFPFVFAVFMAAGVAPLVVSNPMNLIVAEYAGIDFNSYLLRMLPVAVAAWIVSFLMLRLVFRGTLSAAPPIPEPSRNVPWTRKEGAGLLLVLGVLLAYPVLASAGGPLWLAAATGALASLALCYRHGVGSPADIARRNISWDILIFLSLLSTLAAGVQNTGFAAWLAEVYSRGDAVIGTVSALGSALINNHPMSLLNLAALEPVPGSDPKPVLAALIGGDLGPRLLPAGSLAGLLWFATLRRHSVRVPLLMFCGIGALLLPPTLAVSLMVLSVVG